MITIGSATVDVFASSLGETITIQSKEGEEKLVAYPLGSKIVVKEMEFLTGGGGTNSATTFSRLGFKTGYIGKFGKGPNGYKVFKELKAENITFLGAVEEKDCTAFSIILDSAEHDRTILTYRGCCNNLAFDELHKHNLDAKWFYSSSMMDKSYDTLKRVFEHAKKINAKTAFNPGEPQARLGAEFMKPVLVNTDIITMNYEEANILLGKKNAQFEELLKGISGLGPGIVAVTNGKKGIYAYNKEEGMMYRLTPNPDINVFETTGAGDAFGSGFVAGLALGKSFEEALRMGLINSESVIQHLGAKPGILNRKEMESLLKTEKHNIDRKEI